MSCCYPISASKAIIERHVVSTSSFCCFFGLKACSHWIFDWRFLSAAVFTYPTENHLNHSHIVVLLLLSSIDSSLFSCQLLTWGTQFQVVARCCNSIVLLHGDSSIFAQSELCQPTCLKNTLFSQFYLGHAHQWVVIAVSLRHTKSVVPTPFLFSMMLLLTIV